MLGVPPGRLHNYNAPYSAPGWPSIGDVTLRVRWLVDPNLFFYGGQPGAEVWE